MFTRLRLRGNARSRCWRRRMNNRISLKRRSARGGCQREGLCQEDSWCPHFDGANFLRRRNGGTKNLQMSSSGAVFRSALPSRFDASCLRESSGTLPLHNLLSSRQPQFVTSSPSRDSLVYCEMRFRCLLLKVTEVVDESARAQIFQGVSGWHSHCSCTSGRTDLLVWHWRVMAMDKMMRRRKDRDDQRGFGMLEVLIVVAIVTIVSVVAVI